MRGPGRNTRLARRTLPPREQSARSVVRRMNGAPSGGAVAGEPRQTPLIEEHKRLGARMIEFAGWEMPVWYSSVSEEHAAVRTAAGLFDIGHMGVLDIAGDGAEAFLEVVTTAEVAHIGSGRCRYTFVLDPTGLPIDDIIICRLTADRFLAVVNAANHGRVLAWLTGFDQRPEVRDLSDPEAGADRLAGMALQGPVSAQVLAELGDGAGNFAAMRHFAFVEATVAGARALVSRTGYTGEAVGFELFAHPDHVPHLWRAILDAGTPLGVLPAGLGARDSTRIEAGLPLYGHELAGPHEITPPGAGYARFVALDKPDFVGRTGLIERERERHCEIVRFGLDHEGARAIRAEDPVASRRGEMVGWVTSCALAGERQIGMAWVDRRVAREGAELLVYPARQAERSVALSDVASLRLGDRLPLHESAIVLPRFRR